MRVAYSLEVHPPFLDHRIVEFAARLPEHMKINGRQHKVVLKRLMRDKLPMSVLRRANTCLGIPAHDWAPATFRPLLMGTFRSAPICETNLFRRAGIQFFITAHTECR